MKGPFARSGIEGPTYADRVGGFLTFRDWSHWTAEDQAEYREEFEMHKTRERMWADMDADTFSLSDLS